MATSHDILQNLRNRIDTAETGWLAFAESATQSYDAALGEHKKVLSHAKTNVQVSNDQLWKVMNFLLMGVVGPWAPRLLLPVENTAKSVGTYIAGKVFWVDDLAAVWTSQALSHIRPEVESMLKDTALEMMKKRGGNANDPFEPVVAETLIYGSRLKEGIEKRALFLKMAMDQIVESADKWTLTAATGLFDAFVNHSSFITDMPQNTGESFKKTFQKQAELAMWVAWAIERDWNYWSWEQNSPGFFGRGYHAQEERGAMQPILDRLLYLGVRADEVSTTEYLYGSPYKKTFIDMLKLIEWAKRAPKPKGWNTTPAMEVCRPIEPGFLKIKIEENACRR